MGNYSKYTWFELYFSNRWQWVRKRSKQVWVRDMGCWVKFTDADIKYYSGFVGDDVMTHWKQRYTVEDWRQC